MAHIMNFHLNDVYDFQYRGRMVRRQLMGKNSWTKFPRTPWWKDFPVASWE